jgi:hypothetical protein
MARHLRNGAKESSCVGFEGVVAAEVRDDGGDPASQEIDGLLELVGALIVLDLPLDGEGAGLIALGETVVGGVTRLNANVVDLDDHLGPRPA